MISFESDSLLSDVKCYAVWEQNAQSDQDFIGYCYLDLYPRGQYAYHHSRILITRTNGTIESKFPHAAVWKLVTGHTRPDGSRNHPVTAMVANLAKPTPEKPAMIRHADLVTFFHEMGHAFHNLLSKTRFSRFHGTR